MVLTCKLPASDVQRRQQIVDSYESQDFEGECLDALLGTVAHELRSPLASVIGRVYALADGCDVGPPARRTLASIEHQLQQALRIVDDLFDLSAGGLGKLSVDKEVVVLADVVARATESARRLIDARQHQLTMSLPPEPVHLDADPLRLAQVLTNLLCNAAKFTDPGGRIRLSAAVEAGKIVIRVQDNGRGIPPNLVPRVFDLFRQIPAGGGTGGMGIGLALVKALVELHGGTVAAFSDGPGTGSEFVVKLPASACVSRGGVAIARQPFASVR